MCVARCPVTRSPSKPPGTEGRPESAAQKAHSRASIPGHQELCIPPTPPHSRQCPSGPPPPAGMRGSPHLGGACAGRDPGPPWLRPHGGLTGCWTGCRAVSTECAPTHTHTLHMTHPCTHTTHHTHTHHTHTLHITHTCTHTTHTCYTPPTTHKYTHVTHNTHTLQITHI